MKAIRLAVIALLAAALPSCSDGEASKTCNEAADRENAAKTSYYNQLRRTSVKQIYDNISADSAPVMDNLEYPETYKQLGSDGFSRANRLMKWAAAYVVEKGLCNRLDIVMVSDKSRPASISFFALCEDGTKRYVSETDAESEQRAALSGSMADPPTPTPYGRAAIENCIENYRK